jgi:hypothetical protein
VYQLPIAGDLLRARCWSALFVIGAAVRSARAARDPVFVLTVSYAGELTRQLSVRREPVAEVRRWLRNYQELKEAIEAVCELNHDLLRPDAADPKGGRSMIEMRRALLSLATGDCRGSERPSRRLDARRRPGAGG